MRLLRILGSHQQKEPNQVDVDMQLTETQYKAVIKFLLDLLIEAYQF